VSNEHFAFCTEQVSTSTGDTDVSKYYRRDKVTPAIVMTH